MIASFPARMRQSSGTLESGVFVRLSGQAADPVEELGGLRFDVRSMTSDLRSSVSNSKEFIISKLF